MDRFFDFLDFRFFEIWPKSIIKKQGHHSIIKKLPGSTAYLTFVYLFDGFGYNNRFWVQKINNFGLDYLSEDERFQLHVDLEEDLPSLILFMEDKYANDWKKRWEDPSDPLFHPSSPLDGHLLQKAFQIPPGPYLGDLIRHLSKEKAFKRFFTDKEALEVARKWTLENAPFL